MNKYISVIMPAYNLEDKIEESIKELEKILNEITENYEIIIVDDGSKDKTYEKASALANEKIIILKNGVNLGKGEAIKKGTKYINGEYVIILDADGDIQPTNLRTYINALKDYDIIIGSKRHPRSKYEAPLMRKILSISFNKLVKLFIGIKLGDTQTGLKVFKTKYLKTIMNSIIVKRYSWDVEALLIANLLKLKIAEAPVQIKQNARFNIQTILKMLMEILSIIYRYRILHWYQKNLEKELTIQITTRNVIK
jgi:glycosyltransferase involved in cell wall biosynthesis